MHGSCECTQMFGSRTPLLLTPRPASLTVGKTLAASPSVCRSGHICTSWILHGLSLNRCEVACEALPPLPGCSCLESVCITTNALQHKSSACYRARFPLSEVSWPWENLQYIEIPVAQSNLSSRAGAKDSLQDLLQVKNIHVIIPITCPRIADEVVRKAPKLRLINQPGAGIPYSVSRSLCCGRPRCARCAGSLLT